jgi:hypothetical protein
MSDTIHYNMTKKAFEAFLTNVNADVPLEVNIWDRTRLYYDRKGRHLGSWEGGHGWVFASPFNDLLTLENRKVTHA